MVIIPLSFQSMTNVIKVETLVLLLRRLRQSSSNIVESFVYGESCPAQLLDL